MAHNEYPVKQGEDEWFSMRLGIPTASEFKKIITPSKQEYSKQSNEYQWLKIAEIMTGHPQGIMHPTNEMLRGQMLENEARNAYEFVRGVKTRDSGFFTDEKDCFGASPDFCVDEDPEGLGIGEIKCLVGKNHLQYILMKEVPLEFKAQIQGQLYITERDWCDWWLYHPDLPRKCIRVYRDESFIINLAVALGRFREEMAKKIETLQEAGLWDKKEQQEPRQNFEVRQWLK